MKVWGINPPDGV